jgi:hypothetical protein
MNREHRRNEGPKNFGIRRHREESGDDAGMSFEANEIRSKYAVRAGVPIRLRSRR